MGLRNLLINETTPQINPNLALHLNNAEFMRASNALKNTIQRIKEGKQDVMFEITSPEDINYIDDALDLLEESEAKIIGIKTPMFAGVIRLLQTAKLVSEDPHNRFTIEIIDCSQVEYDNTEDNASDVLKREATSSICAFLENKNNCVKTLDISNNKAFRVSKNRKRLFDTMISSPKCEITSLIMDDIENRGTDFNEKLGCEETTTLIDIAREGKIFEIEGYVVMDHHHDTRRSFKEDRAYIADFVETLETTLEYNQLRSKGIPIMADIKTITTANSIPVLKPAFGQTTNTKSQAAEERNNKISLKIKKLRDREGQNVASARP